MTFAMGRAPAPGSDRIPVELFQILKDDAVESAALNMQYAICTQYAICRLLAVHQQMNRRAKWGTMYKEYVFCSLVVAKSCPTLCDPMTVGYACQAPLWNSPGKNAGVGSHSLLQGIFLTQGSLSPTLQAGLGDPVLCLYIDVLKN